MTYVTETHMILDVQYNKKKCNNIYYFCPLDDIPKENYDTQSHILERLVYLERQEHTSQMCRLYKLSKHDDNNYQQAVNDSILLDHILVDHRHKLLYCYVPKVSTNYCFINCTNIF